MTYPQDFHRSCPKMEKGDETIDSYALFKRTIEVVDRFNIQFCLDNSLPLVTGNPESLEKIFMDFIMNGINEFKGHKGTLHVSFRKELDSSFLMFFTLDQFPEDPGKGISNLVDTISEFNLAICKDLLEEREAIRHGLSEPAFAPCPLKNTRNRYID